MNIFFKLIFVLLYVTKYKFYILFYRQLILEIFGASSPNYVDLKMEPFVRLWSGQKAKLLRTRE